MLKYTANGEIVKEETENKTSCEIQSTSISGFDKESSYAEYKSETVEKFTNQGKNIKTILQPMTRFRF